MLCRYGRIAIVAAGLLKCIVAAAATFGKVCTLQGSPPVWLKYDPVTEQLSLFETTAGSDHGDQDDDGGRALGRQVTVQNGTQDVGLMGRPFPNLFRGPRSKRSFLARSCPCDESGRTYCLVEDLAGAVPDHCGVFWSPTGLRDDAGSRAADVGCFALTSQTSFVRNAWPVVVLWYSALLIFLLATTNGRFARAYLAHVLCPGRRTNERRVEEILTREEHARRRLRAAALRAGPGRHLRRARGIRVRREGEPGEATRWWIEQAEQWVWGGTASEEEDSGVEHILRTRKFDARGERARRTRVGGLALEDGGTVTEGKDVPSSSVEQETKARPSPLTPKSGGTSLDGGSDTKPSLPADPSSEPDDDALTEGGASSALPHDDGSEDKEDVVVECSICLAEVEDGARVGVLTCHHVFHAECLVTWIAHRNVCPLCQAPGIAVPRVTANMGGERNNRERDPSLDPPSSSTGALDVDVPRAAARGGEEARPGADRGMSAVDAEPQHTTVFSPLARELRGRTASRSPSPTRLSLSLSSSSGHSSPTSRRRRGDSTGRQRRRGP